MIVSSGVNLSFNKYDKLIVFLNGLMMTFYINKISVSMRYLMSFVMRSEASANGIANVPILFCHCEGTKQSRVERLPCKFAIASFLAMTRRFRMRAKA